MPSRTAQGFGMDQLSSTILNSLANVGVAGPPPTMPNGQPFPNEEGPEGPPVGPIAGINPPVIPTPEPIRPVPVEKVGGEKPNLETPGGPGVGGVREGTTPEQIAAFQQEQAAQHPFVGAIEPPSRFRPTFAGPTPNVVMTPSGPAATRGGVGPDFWALLRMAAQVLGQAR